MTTKGTARGRVLVTNGTVLNMHDLFVYLPCIRLMHGDEGLAKRKWRRCNEIQKKNEKDER